MNDFSNNKTIRCHMTEKSVGDLRLLGKYSATLTFEPTKRGIWEVDSGGRLSIHPDTRFNEYNAKSLLGMFDFDQDDVQFDDLARGEFKVTQSPLVTFLDDGTFELTSRGILQSLNQSLEQPYNPEPIKEVDSPETIEEVEVTQTNEPTQKLETPEIIEEVGVTQTNEPTQVLETPKTTEEVEATQTTIELDSPVAQNQTLSEEQPSQSSKLTSTTLIQLQNNAVLIRQSEKVNEKYDEILDLIDTKTAQQFAAIPARFESDTSSLDLDNDFAQKIESSHIVKVSETESFRNEVIESVEQEEKKGKGWFQAFKDSLSSESIQNKLQSFKDKISDRVVALGNKIASLPEEIATQSVMKTALEKVKKGRSMAPPTQGKETYQVGDYQVVASQDNQFSLLDKQGNKLVDFSANDHLKNPSLISKSSQANASQILKEIKHKPVELNSQSAQQREILINAVSEQMQAFPKGRSVGENNQYTVRAYQGEKYLDGGFSHQITNNDLNSLSYKDLESLSQQFEQEHQQIQAETAMPVFTKILKAHESYEVNSNGSNLQYNPDDRTMTFTSSQGETIKARSLGHGQWEHLKGKLSPETIAELKHNLEPQVDRYFEQKAQKDQTREVLQTLG